MRPKSKAFYDLLRKLSDNRTITVEQEDEIWEAAQAMATEFSETVCEMVREINKKGVA